MREKTIKIGERLWEKAAQLRAQFPASEQKWDGSKEQVAYFVLRAISRIIAEELDSKAPGGEDSGVAPRSTMSDGELLSHCRESHHRLHGALDELLACYLTETGKLPSKSGLLEFLEWSFKMKGSPTCARKHGNGG